MNSIIRPGSTRYFAVVESADEILSGGDDGLVLLRVLRYQVQEGGDELINVP